MIESIYNRFISENITGAEAIEKSGLKKEDLVDAMNNGDGLAAILLLFGFMNHKRRYWVEDWEDEDTGDIIPIERSVESEEYLFQSEPGEVEKVESIVASVVKDLPDERLHLCLKLFIQADIPSRERIPLPIISELAERGDTFAFEWMGDYYAGNYPTYSLYKIDKKRAEEYYAKALETGLSKGAYASDIFRLRHGIPRVSNFEWVFNNRVLDDVCDPLSGFFSFDDYPFEMCSQCALDYLWLYKFPSPMGRDAFWSDEEEKDCTISDVTNELISRGISESSFHEYNHGIMVDLKNVSFYMVVGPVDESDAAEGILAVAPHYHNSACLQKHHCFMSEVLFNADDYATCMLELDRETPEVNMALSLIYDKLCEEREEKGKRIASVRSYIETLFQGSLPKEIVSIDYLYLYGEDPDTGDSLSHWLEFNLNYCRESVSIRLGDDRYIKINPCDLNRLSREVFVWLIENERFSEQTVTIEQINDDGMDHLVVHNYDDNKEELPSSWLV